MNRAGTNDVWSRRQWLSVALAACAMPCETGPAYAQPPTSSPPVSRVVESVRISKAGTHQQVASQIYRLPPVDANVKRVVVTAMAVDPLGQFLAAAGDDHIIRILDAETLQVLVTLGKGRTDRPKATDQNHQSMRSDAGHFDWIRTLTFDPYGNRLASAGNDGQLIIWDRRRQFELLQRIGAAPALSCLTFSPSGKQMAAVGFDRQVFLIGKDARKLPELKCDCVDLRCCGYGPQAQWLAVGGRDGHLHVFDPKTGETIVERDLHEGRIRDLAFMPNSNVLVSVGEDGQMIRFDCKTKTLLSRERISSGRLFSIAIIGSHLIAAAGSDDAIHLVRIGQDNEQLETEARLIGHVGSISKLVMLGGELVSGGFDATIRRWKVNDPASPPSQIARGDSDPGPR